MSAKNPGDPIVLNAHGRRIELHTADVLAWSAAYDGPPFHAILTDWPYLLEFLNSKADRPHLDRYRGEQAFRQTVDAVCELIGWPTWVGAGVLWYRDMAAALTPLLHPGALHFGFGGTRTFGLLKAGLLGAGWDVHDTVLGWLYGQGQTKGQRIDKMVDRRLGKSDARPTIGEYDTRSLYDGAARAPVAYPHLRGDGRPDPTPLTSRVQQTAPATDQAARWADHRTPSLAPGWEPILMAHTPRQETYAEAALAHGAGTINRELGAVPFGDTFGEGAGGWRTDKAGYGGGWGAPGKRHRARRGHWGGDNATCKSGFNDSPGGRQYKTEQHPGGRFPVNVILDEAAAAQLDAGGPTPRSGGYPRRRLSGRKSWSGGWREGEGEELPNAGLRYGDGRMPSRFFYVAKASKRERSAGLRPDLCYRCWQTVEGAACPRCSTKRRPVRPGRNPHVAVKPVQIALILARILLPPPLDAPRRLLIPCGGSGSEAIGAYLAGGTADGWDEIVLVEREAGYVRVAEERLRYWMQFTDYDEALKSAPQVQGRRRAHQPPPFEVKDA
jgi:site-specific DNA-methyltransferase (adenine-specific)